MKQSVGLTPLLAILLCGNVIADGVPAPSYKVEVLACQTGSPDEFEYTVKNMGPTGIETVSIGDSMDGPTLVGYPKIVLSQVLAPAGWKSRVAYGYESEYYSVEWRPEKQGSVIPAGTSLGGFRILVPGGHEKEVRTMKDTMMPFPVFTSVGFGVIFKDSKVVYGVVKASGCPKTKK